MSSTPLIQGRDYDAKIAFYDDPVNRIDDVMNSAFNVDRYKSDHSELQPGEVTATVRIWSTKESFFFPGKLDTDEWTSGPAYSHGISYKLPTRLPLNSLLHGREGDVIKVKVRGFEYRLLCAQKESNIPNVDWINFQDWIFKPKKECRAPPKFLDDTIIDFDAKKYLTDFLEKKVPKITGAVVDHYYKFKWVETEKADQVFDQFQKSLAAEPKHMGTLCELLRTRLIEKQEPELWFDLYLISQDRPALRELNQVCIVMAQYRPDISKWYAIDNSPMQLKKLATADEIRAKSNEAKILNRNEVVRNLRTILNLES